MTKQPYSTLAQIPTLDNLPVIPKKIVFIENVPQKIDSQDNSPLIISENKANLLSTASNNNSNGNLKEKNTIKSAKKTIKKIKIIVIILTITSLISCASVSVFITMTILSTNEVETFSYIGSILNNLASVAEVSRLLDYKIPGLNTTFYQEKLTKSSAELIFVRNHLFKDLKN